MYKEYRELYEKYRVQYGEKTAIFLQVGSFYELYDSQDPLTGVTKCNSRDIVDYLGIQLTYRRGDGERWEGNAWDGLFAGIPDHSLHKWAGRLTDAGWTVVVVDQVKDASGRVMRREVARILSPGTHIENANGAESPTAAAIWFDAMGLDTAAPRFGIAVLDLTTGVTQTASGATQGDIGTWTSDVLIQFIQIQNPREVIVFWRGDSLTMPDEGTLRRRLGYSNGGLLHIRSALPEYQGAFESPLSREEFLRATYCIRSLLPTREWLYIYDDMLQERVLIGLLRFIQDHFPSALASLQKNCQWSPRETLVLGNHALTQLQLSAGRVQDSVLGIFKSCVTPMGKRAIRGRILTPSSDADTILQRISEVDAYIAFQAGQGQGQTQATELLRALKGVYDLPRLHRKIYCSSVTAADIICLDQSYTIAEYIGGLALPAALAPPNNLIARLRDWKAAHFDSKFSVKKAYAISDDTTFLLTGNGQYDEIAAIEAKLSDIRESVTRFVELCNSVAGRSKDSTGFKIEERDKQPYSIRGTKAALQVLQNALKSASAPQSIIDAMKGVEVTIQKGGGWIDVPWLTITNGEVGRLRERLVAEVALLLPGICASVADGAPWQEVEDWLTGIDITQCIARESLANGFCRPDIIGGGPGPSLIDATGLRHPLIEMTLTRTQYVTHNVSIGSDASGGCRSWLVYGMNASGKSSLMKSIGIAVHLAQAGCYVPATTFKLRPFRAIYTRILNQDNLWAGLSSFAVEMSEMRDILNTADERTLVLGDELCSGTESVSAQALVAAGIKWLSARNARFVFATHLHGLLDILPDQATLGMQVWHLKVVYDVARDRLIYERTLKPGAGSTLYGIEVARAMHLPTDFIESAQEFRRRIQGAVSFEEAKGSAWNSAIFRRKCEVCGCEIVNALEVHHIRPRVDAGGKTHFDDGSRRDDVRNLIVVCSKCHDDSHSGHLEIGALVQTSDGPMRQPAASAVDMPTLSVSSGEDPVAPVSPITNMTKWTEAEMNIIVNTLRVNKIVPLKQLAFRLKLENNIDISESTLRKIRRS